MVKINKKIESISRESDTDNSKESIQDTSSIDLELPKEITEYLINQKEINKDFKEFKNSIDNKTEEISKKIEDVERDIKKMTNKNIETLGIFVALFTFISVSIQIFSSSINPFFNLGIFLLILISIGFFILFLDFVINQEKSFLISNKDIVLVILFLTLVGSIASIIYSHKNIKFKELYSEKVEEIIQKKDDDIKIIIQENKKELDDFKNCIYTKGLNKCVGYEK